MDDRAEGQDVENSRAMARLDGPTSELLAAARRARGTALKEMMGEGIRRLRTMLAGAGPRLERQR
jgi:hypothetical protein